MILGAYFVFISAWVGTWFRAELGMTTPEELMNSACCNPNMLLPDVVVSWLAYQVQADHCGQLWCFYGVFLVLYMGFVLMISWLFSIALFSTKQNPLGWGILLYILIELILAVVLAFYKWIQLIKQSGFMAKKYQKFTAENPGADFESFKDEVHTNGNL